VFNTHGGKHGVTQCAGAHSRAAHNTTCPGAEGVIIGAVLGRALHRLCNKAPGHDGHELDAKAKPIARGQVSKSIITTYLLIIYYDRVGGGTQ